MGVIGNPISGSLNSDSVSVSNISVTTSDSSLATGATAQAQTQPQALAQTQPKTQAEALAQIEAQTQAEGLAQIQAQEQTQTEVLPQAQPQPEAPQQAVITQPILAGLGPLDPGVVDFSVGLGPLGDLGIGLSRAEQNIINSGLTANLQAAQPAGKYAENLT